MFVFFFFVCVLFVIWLITEFSPFYKFRDHSRNHSITKTFLYHVCDPSRIPLYHVCDSSRIPFLYHVRDHSRSHSITKTFLYHVCDPSRIPYFHKNNRRNMLSFSTATSFRTATMVAIFFQHCDQSRNPFSHVLWNRIFISLQSRLAYITSYKILY